MDNKNPARPKIPFFNLRVDQLTKNALLDELDVLLSQTRRRISINFLNAHCFNVAQENPEYRFALDRCTYLLNDGIGIDLAARLIGVRFEENLNGTDLIPELLAFMAGKGMSVFFFGARPEVIREAVSRIEQQFPGLVIAGYSHGFVSSPESIVEQVNASGADAVILGLGVPRQELWVDQHFDKLENARLCVSGGAFFDFVSGTVRRAPKFMRRLKLEWFFRLLQEPKRLFPRYIFGNVIFLHHVLVRYRR